MALSLLCDEHVPYPIVKGLKRRNLDVVTVQDVGLRSVRDERILEVARQQGRIIYTQDADFLRHHATGTEHGGILYHHLLAYPIGEAIRRVVLACEVYAPEELKNHVEFI